MITFKQKLTAIKGSIKKWDMVSHLETDGDRRSNCPLCTLYWAKGLTASRCCDCPIYEKTGEVECRGTPFYKWHCDKTSDNAEAFRDWLKDLYIEVSEKGEGGEVTTRWSFDKESKEWVCDGTMEERIEKLEKKMKICYRRIK